MGFKTNNSGSLLLNFSMELEPNGSLILKYLQLKKKEINDSLEIQRTTPTRIQSGSLGVFFNRIASPRVNIPGRYPLVLSSWKVGGYLC
jgi:hypothetical protein